MEAVIGLLLTVAFIAFIIYVVDSLGILRRRQQETLDVLRSIDNRLRSIVHDSHSQHVQ